jgi:Cu+-exporting ATPase
MPIEANNLSTELVVTGMTCGNCARHVTDAIQGVSGVRSATVSLDSSSASVRWSDAGRHDVPALIKAIEDEGYGAKVVAADERDQGHQRMAGWHMNLVIAVLGTAPLMIGEWIFQIGMMRWFQWFSFVLAGIVQVFAGAQFYRGAWNQLKVRSSNMDTLVALGSTTAFGFSLWGLFTGYSGHLYFLESASIIMLISVGHWIESRVSVHASDALRKLLNLAPAMARRRNGDGNEVEVPVADLHIGDLVSLRPGDRVPTDGKVTEGDSAVDEAMLTGESAPVDKAAGSELYAGTVNLNGRLVMRVTATGDETALAHIIASVQRAQTSRANIQRLGDRVSSVFVPIIVLVALAAGLWWGLAPESAEQVHNWLVQFLWHTHFSREAAGFIIAAAVLIIACPCAMGLATPAAIMAGSNAAARRGILIRDGVALEKAGKITAVIFDKTGTLTEGKPKVVKIQTFPLELDSELKTVPIEGLGSSLALLSNHPLSKAVAETSAVHRELKDFRELPGRGTTGVLQVQTSGATHVLRLGSPRWLAEEKIDFGPAQRFADEWMNQGATVLGLAANGRLIAAYALQDLPKPGAAEVIKELGNSMGVYLISGDSNRSVNAIADKLGINQCTRTAIFAEVRPEDKAAIVRQLQQQGERVAFVGDGINDAPALEQADLGVAVSRASDIAREAADIILLKSDIEAVPEALGLARATLRTIKQNLFWAFFYNAIGVPLAALGFMSPILCAAAMGFSDLIVIGNALRLRNWRPAIRP